MTTPSLSTLLLLQQISHIRTGDRAAQDDLARAVADRMAGLAHPMLRDPPNVHRWANTNDGCQIAVWRPCRHRVTSTSRRGLHYFLPRLGPVRTSKRWGMRSWIRAWSERVR